MRLHNCLMKVITEDIDLNGVILQEICQAVPLMPALNVRNRCSLYFEYVPGNTDTLALPVLVDK